MLILLYAELQEIEAQIFIVNFAGTSGSQCQATLRLGFGSCNTAQVETNNTVEVTVNRQF